MPILAGQVPAPEVSTCIIAVCMYVSQHECVEILSLTLRLVGWEGTSTCTAHGSWESP